MTDKQIIDNAHRCRVQKEMQALSDWCLSRASGKRNTETTLSLLDKKIGLIRGKVRKSGFDAINSHYLNK